MPNSVRHNFELSAPAAFAGASHSLEQAVDPSVRGLPHIAVQVANGNHPSIDLPAYSRLSARRFQKGASP